MPPHPPLPTEPRDDTDREIARLHADALHDGEISDALGIPRKTIQARRARMKLPPNLPRGKTRRGGGGGKGAGEGLASRPDFPVSAGFPMRETRQIRETERAVMPPREEGPQGVPAPPHLPHPKDIEVPEWAARLSRGGESGRLEIPESPAPDADAFLELSGDYGIISDLHIPYMSKRVITRFLDDCEAAGLRRAIVAGDWLDGGQFHPKRGPNQHHKRRFQEDADLAKEVFRAMLSRLDSLTLLMGNHDQWFAAHMRGQIDPEWLLSNIFHEFADRIVFSEFEQCRVTSAAGVVIRVLHGANYSSASPLGNAKRLAAKFESGIVMGHQHSHETGRSASGLHQVVCMGGAHEPRKMAYLHASPRTNPCQTQGYCLFRGGYLHAVDATERQSITRY